jgi:phage FluMu protein Com
MKRCQPVSLAFTAVLTSLEDFTTINSKGLISCPRCTTVNPQQEKEESVQGRDFQSQCSNRVPPGDSKKSGILWRPPAWLGCLVMCHFRKFII